ncbi:MAG: hypothetical protein ACT4PE_02545, partial [Candidatus Eiseniibacteriota bacterium]
MSKGRSSDHLHGLAAALLAFAVFAGILSHELVWDDPALLESARGAVRSGGLGALLRAEFVLDPLSGESTGYYRPVVLGSGSRTNSARSRAPRPPERTAPRADSSSAGSSQTS